MIRARLSRTLRLKLISPNVERLLGVIPVTVRLET
jgi:hypothetical protein